jgi:hypothetical protein
VHFDSFIATAALVAGALSPAPQSPGGREEVAALVARCVSAYGGEAALAKAGTARQQGRVTSIMHAGGAGRIVRASARPGRLRVEVEFPGESPEIRVVDGARGWRNGEEVDGPRLAAMVLQAARLDLPALLSARGAKVVDRGEAELEGSPVPVRVLALEPAPGIVVEAAIDTRTARVVRSHGFTRGPGPPIEFVTTYSDFRTVDGVLVAFREENWANGRATGETVLERVEFPSALPPATFRP